MTNPFAGWALLLAAAALIPAYWAYVDAEAPPLRGELRCSHTCSDLNGTGTLATTCVIATSATLSASACFHGAGSLSILPGVTVACALPGCYLAFNLSGTITLSASAQLVAGSVTLHASNVTLGANAAVNATALAGEPPPQTSGTPHSLEAAGGGHGGRGASCKVSNDTNWGGDVYAWASLDNPWSYGSKGGSFSPKDDEQLGGDGGGRVLLRASEILSVDGVVLAEGGVGGLRGGGGSGGSIIIQAYKLWTEFWVP